METKTDSADLKKPVEIADRIWWVGHYLEDDSFQCHCYLIENGSNSILLDPGSRLTFYHTLAKIEQIINFSDIKYFIVHHQDPDITGALDIIDRLITRDDAVILSHWRAIALLRHLDLKMPLKCVEEMGWELKSGDRDLKFIFTPYLHFPGAFCTFDRKTGSLFSSDIAGGFTEGFSLFAEDESYLESVRLFHEHYMPSREILASAITKFQELPLKRILPQHGSIITGDLVPFILEQLKNLDCGLYMLTKTNSEIRKLSKLQRFMSDFMKTLIFHRDFNTTADQLLKHIRQIIPAENLKFLIITDEGGWQILEEETRYRGKKTTPQRAILEIYNESEKDSSRDFFITGIRNSIILPLKYEESSKIFALALLDLSEKIIIDEETENILKQITLPLCIAVERELIQKRMDSEKQALYELSIKDNLTGLYNRTYMNDTVPRLFSHHDRSLLKDIALLMIDLDHFKSVNDIYGHNTGDIVLKKTAEVIKNSLRSGDFAVRVGGEEIAVFLITEEGRDAVKASERIRNKIKEIDFSDCMKNNQTASGGIVLRRKEETSEELFARADSCLYKAKKEGRDRIVSGI